MDEGVAKFRKEHIYLPGQATADTQPVCLAPALRHSTFDCTALQLQPHNLFTNDTSDSHHRGTIATPSQSTVEARSSSCCDPVAAHRASTNEDASLLNELLVHCGDRMVRAS